MSAARRSINASLADDWKTLRTCNSNGTWESLKCELGCTSGRCNDCEDGTRRCSGSTAIQICENGYWPPPVSCGDQKICTQRGNSYDCMIDESISCTSGAFKCATCKIDPKKTCSNRCDSNSTWYTDAVCNNGCNEATGKCY